MSLMSGRRHVLDLKTLNKKKTIGLFFSNWVEVLM